jgi:signal transduction histidine kinase
MRRLSIRIFLSFWFALIVIAVAAFGVTLLVFVEHTGDVRELRRGLVGDGAAALAQGGRESLVRWLAAFSDARNNTPAGTRVYVLDDAGHELLGRPLPRIARVGGGREGRVGPIERIQGRPLESPTDLGGVRYVPPEPLPLLVAPDGATYRFLVLPRRPGPIGLLGPLGGPAMRYAVLAIALLVTGLVSWLLARSITLPIDDLTAATESLAAGRLETALSPRTVARRDEVGRLATSFGRMAGRIRELLASREQLLRDVSHELRSPLARMRVALGLARQPAADVMRQLDRMERESERLDELIGQVLAVSRLDAGGEVLVKTPTDLVPLIEGIARDAAFEAEATGKSVRVDRGVGTAVVAADATWIASAIENVVRNAVRHTAPGTVVTVEVASDTHSVRIVVRDHGPGVPSAELEQIFEPFHRVADSRDRQSGGEGLGLAITARVMRAHGGTVRASNVPDGGLAVEMRMPLSVA